MDHRRKRTSFNYDDVGLPVPAKTCIGFRLQATKKPGVARSSIEVLAKRCNHCQANSTILGVFDIHG